MDKNLQGFEYACKIYLSILGIGDLRNYGREIGVARPTTKRKEDLIEDIIAILTGKMQPIEVSKQGAPVKNDRVDERIPAKIESLKREFFSKTPVSEFSTVGVGTGRRSPWTMSVASPNVNQHAKKSVEGQVTYQNGQYYLMPLNGAISEEKVLLPSEVMQGKDLREGDVLVCNARVYGEMCTVEEVLRVNGLPLKKLSYRGHFDDFTAKTSNERIRVYDGGAHASLTLKFIEWLLPLGKGQRGCVISSPKAGKSRLLLQIAEAANALNPDLEVYVLLVDQSPETVGEFRRKIGEERLLYTTYEDDAEKQVYVCDFLLKRIKRKAEAKKDVLLLVDSLTALARAFNDTDASSGGKTLSCGLEIKTVRYMKKFFGAARALDVGGSITVLGSVCADTGNPFDDVVCAEFASQANYEIHLDNALAMRRVYPAIDMSLSKAKLSEMLKNEREEEFDCYIRNEILPKLGVEGLLRIMNEANSYEDFYNKIESL